MIVVDVGCMDHGEEQSIGPLVRTLHPEVIFGFDPHPDLAEGVEVIDGTVVVRRRLAAWTNNGTMPLYVSGTVTGIEERVPVLAECDCFDLPEWLWTLPRGSVLKLDAEGAEYPILERVAALNVDTHLGMVIVEWHPPATAHGLIRSRPVLRCSVQEWPS